MSVQVSLNEQPDDAFFDKYLRPFIRETVIKSCSKDFICSGNGALDPSTALKKKADFMLGFKDRKRTVHFFYVELKRPGKLSRYQEEDYFIKLLKHMKYSIDNQANLGIENSVALGLLCEGFLCSFVKMTLAEEGVYLPVTLRKFRLPKSELDLINIPRVVECLYFVLEEVKRFQGKYNARNKKATIKKFAKPSFDTKFIKK